MSELPLGSVRKVSNSRTICRAMAVLLLAVWSLWALWEGSGFRLLEKHWQYCGIIPVTVILLICFFVSCRNIEIARRHITVPSVLFLLGMAYFIYIGTLDLSFQVAADAEFTFLPSLPTGYRLIGFGLLAWAGGSLLGRWAFRRVGTNRPRSALIWDTDRLFLVSLFWCVVGSVSFVVFYVYYIGGSPFLRGISPNADAGLRELMFGKARNVSVVAFNATNLAIITAGVYLINCTRRRTMVMVQLILAIVWFLLWGARTYIALPGMICFVLLIGRKAWSLRRTVSVLLVLFAAAAVYGLARNRAFYNIEFSNRTIVEKLADLHTGPEFRDTLGVISHQEELRELYKPSCYFQGIYFTAVPKRVLGLIGVDKDVLFSDEGSGISLLTAQITRGLSWGGIRPGIIGQTLMAFGQTGVVVVFLLYGLLFSLLDALSRRYEIASPGSLLVYGSAVIFSYSLVATTHNTFAKFWYFLYGSILMIILAARQVRRSA